MNTGTCPVCNGTLRRPYDLEPRYANVIAGYDKETHTLPCNNCGGQKMYTNPTGIVPLRKDGTPCLHEYKSIVNRMCYVQFQCIHCGDKYEIDSGD